MADETKGVNDVVSTALSAVSGNTDPKELGIESLVLLINTERLRFLENKITKEFIELKRRQDDVSFLHKLIKSVNSSTTNEELDCSKNTELQQMLKKATELGVDLKVDKFKYTKDERERLIENIRLTSENLNVINDMKFQTFSRLTTERYESYQLARSIMKPLHEDKIDKARAIAGR